MIEYLGNTLLLKRRLVAFLAPSRIVPESVLPTLDWAATMARKRRVVVSGFMSRLETDVWDVLVRNGASIVVVLARSKYKSIPARYQPLLRSGRLLLVFLGLGARIDRYVAFRRNDYVATIAAEVVFPSISRASTLNPIYHDQITAGKPVTVIAQ